MTTHTFNIGDTVVVSIRDVLYARKVASIHKRKKSTKITLNDGSAWSADGKSWSRPSYCTNRMSPLTPELRDRLLDQQRRSAVEWMAKNWNTLPAEVRERLGDEARIARKAMS